MPLGHFFSSDVVTISPKRFRIFGGSLRSDLDFPILPPAPTDDATTWTLYVNAAPAPDCAAACRWPTQSSSPAPRAGPHPDRAGGLPVEAAGEGDPDDPIAGPGVQGSEIWAITDTGAFDVAADGRSITWYRPPDADEVNARLDVVGTLLPFALHLTDRLVLHGSAVAFEAGAVAFLAPSGVGKSTLAMSLTTAGARFLSDDALPVRIAGSTAFAAPGVPSPRFREDSFARFSDLLPTEAVPSSGKLTMRDRLGDDLVETRERPLVAVYVLQPVSPEEGARATRTAVPPIAATMELVRNTKLAKLLWAEESERLLRLVSEVARRVPVYTLEVPRNLDLLPEVVDQLLEWHAVPRPQPA